MNIQQFKQVSHVTYGCLDMPESDVELIARPGEKYIDPSDWSIFFPKKLKAADYIYEFGMWRCGTAKEVINYYEGTYEGRLVCEFSKEKDRHIFRFRPWAVVHFLDGSKQTIYFDKNEDITNFMASMKAHAELDKHLMTNCGTLVGIGGIESTDIK